MNYGNAIVGLKNGQRIARDGWNGKNMFVWMENGSADRHRVKVALENGGLISGVSLEHFDLGDDNTVTRMPHLCMRAADGSKVTGWLASQTDMLAEDWSILP